MKATKITAEFIRAMKNRERIAALTAYDFGMAKYLDAAGLPLLLVGDSLGMVVLGYPDTTHVTMDDMAHHVRAVARAKPRALLVADLPFDSCRTPEAALENTRILLGAGAEAIKAEGGRNILPQVKAIVAAGVPFLGHLGMLPQNVVAEGGYHVKGKTEHERSGLMEDAVALAEAGAFGIVLELVTSPVAREITARISIPTIGIGSGPDCDGEILVTTDLLGTSPGFIPRHVKKNWQFAEQMRAAVVEWKEGVVRPESEMTRFSHLDARGEAKMVDVSAKPPMLRHAVASGEICLNAETIVAIEKDQVAKGNVFATARIAGIMAAKETGSLIPLCHPLPISHCGVDFAIPASRDRILITASATITAATGVEMEALTAVTVAALTIYDMCKAVDKTMRITNVTLVSKTKIKCKSPRA